MPNHFLERRRDMLNILIGIGLAGAIQRFAPPPQENTIINLIHDVNSAADRVRSFEPTHTISPSTGPDSSIIIFPSQTPLNK